MWCLTSRGGNFFRMVLPRPGDTVPADTSTDYATSTPRIGRNNVSLLNTVTENREGFARREYEGARGGATGAMHLLEFPSERDL